MHDPGGKGFSALPPGMTGWADMSECTFYRTALGREWQPTLYGKTGLVLFTGLNPSTADALVNDQTIRREISYAKAWGYSRLVKVNISDYRATDQRDLLTVRLPPCSMRNAESVYGWGEKADLIVFATGNVPKPLAHLARGFVEGFRERGRPLHCLGLTGAGWPVHTSRLANGLPLVPYGGERV